MTCTELDVLNMAMDHLGKSGSTSVANGSTAQRQLRNTRRRVLRAFPWSFATITNCLEQIEFDSACKTNCILPYAFREPGPPCDILRLVEVTYCPCKGAEPIQVKHQRGVLEIPQPGCDYRKEKVIFTDCAGCVTFQWTYDETNCAQWEDDALHIWSLELALVMAPSQSVKESTIGRIAGMLRMAKETAYHVDSVQEEMPKGVIHSTYSNAMRCC